MQHTNYIAEAITFITTYATKRAASNTCYRKSSRSEHAGTKASKIMSCLNMEHARILY